MVENSMLQALKIKVNEVPSTKLQITNKLQILISNDQNICLEF